MSRARRLRRTRPTGNGPRVRRTWLDAHQVNISTPAALLNSETRVWAVEIGADVAIKNGRAAVVVGWSAGYLVICRDGCCASRDGVLIVVPDVVIAEGHANGLDLPPGSPRLRRTDGRSAAVFAGVGRD